MHVDGAVHHGCRRYRLVLLLLRRTPAQQFRRISDKIRRGRRRLFGIELPQWFREFLLHDTRPDIAAVEVPILAITGSKDIQVDPDDLDEIALWVAAHRPATTP